MKALNEKEIDNMAASLAGLAGSRLREAVVASKACGFGFATEMGLAWLWVELASFRPVIVPLNQAPASSVKPMRPLLLFLRAHFLGKRLVGCRRDSELGRALRLEFAPGEGEDPLSIEIRLWPHGQNVIAYAGTRKVAFSRIQAVDSRAEKSPVDERAAEQARTVEEVFAEWQASGLGGDVGAGPKNKKSEPRPADTQAADARLKKLREKTEKALEKVRAELKAKEGNPWRKVGDWLTANQTLDAPGEIAALVDRRHSLAWNIENCFSRAKENERKVGGTQERVEKLERELARMAQVTDPVTFFAREASPREKRSEPAHRADKLKLRTLHLGGGLRACLGKSARENLDLLRVARPWDYWLHLKDFPGSHGIIFRERQAKVNDELLRKVGRWLVESKFPGKVKERVGEHFDLLVAECRFVRPIRGDKLGRVTYSNERVLTVRV